MAHIVRRSLLLSAAAFQRPSFLTSSLLPRNPSPSSARPQRQRHTAMSTSAPSSRAPVPTTAAENPLLASVMAAMHAIAPLSLADTSWDNVGLLVEAPPPPSSSSPTASASSGNGGGGGENKQSIMLGIDLTTSVCDEMLSSNPRPGVAIIYHPLIFRGLKSLTHADPQQRSILRLLQAGVSVYCPHTSLDATPGGINDWLAVVVSHDEMPDLEGERGMVTLTRGEWRPIEPSKEKDAQGLQGAGMGRIVTLQEEQGFENLVERIKRNLDLDHVQGCKASDRLIRTIGVCAGSGSSVFRGVKADLLLTGELSHHEVLAYKASGTSVIVTNHSNTERKYLRDVLQHRLAALLPSEVRILISKEDRDPLSTF